MASDEARSKIAKAATEASGLLRAPARVIPLLRKLVIDSIRLTLERRHLYSYASTQRDSAEVLNSLLRWILDAQRPDGGIAAYYSLLTGYSESYPEVTGYIIPTLYDFAGVNGDKAAAARASAERATRWLLSLQMQSGAFPAGLQGKPDKQAQPSVFNTGQIVQGLVRADRETNNLEARKAATRAGDWLVAVQQADGCWSGPGAYQHERHTYYSMVAWALAELSERSCAWDSQRDQPYRKAAEKNLDWVMSHFRPSGWIDGINLRDHATYLHFIAYAIQGALETGVLLRRKDAVDTVARSASVLLRKFETNKFLPGAYEADFKAGHRFTCLTGNAQMSCIWLRLSELTNDLHYLNAALKMNEMLKAMILTRGPAGIIGGVSGSYPIWGRYQPLRFISWGSKFLADALLLEGRMKQLLLSEEVEVLPCAS
jgi:hypothetical protein